MATTASQFPAKAGKLASLEVGRGVAALAVVLSHCGLKTDAFTSGTKGAWFEWGVYGVDFFFVLSGFIIYFVHHQDPPGMQSARHFLGKRLKRIFIPYLPIGIGMLWSTHSSQPSPAATMPGTGYPPSRSSLWGQVPLCPSRGHSFLR